MDALNSTIVMFVILEEGIKLKNINIYIYISDTLTGLNKIVNNFTK